MEGIVDPGCNMHTALPRVKFSLPGQGRDKQSLVRALHRGKIDDPIANM